MTSESKALIRKRIILKLMSMKIDLTQVISDKESWNDNREEEAPFDLGWDKVMLHCVTEALYAWESDDLAAVKHWSEKIDELSEVANRV